MVDTGATANFINRRTVEELGLQVQLKQRPIQVNVVDGREISEGLITEEVLVTLTINDHTEDIMLNITELGNFVIILGTPWLQKHDPRIFWKTNKVLFG